MTQDIVQAGSTFKPFALVAALWRASATRGTATPKPPDDTSLSLRSRFDGNAATAEVSAGQARHTTTATKPRHVDLVNATAESVNTAYTALNKKIGPSTPRRRDLRRLPEEHAGRHPEEVADPLKRPRGELTPPGRRRPRLRDVRRSGRPPRLVS